MTSHRARLSRLLPRNYFADAQAHTLAESENRGRSVAHTAGAASREAAGESDSANTFGARTTQERSDKTNTATNATPCAAPTLSGVKGSAGVCTTGGAMPSRAAGQSFAGVCSSPAFEATAGSGYGVLGAGNRLDDYEREQLQAARILNP